MGLLGTLAVVFLALGAILKYVGRPLPEGSDSAGAAVLASRAGNAFLVAGALALLAGYAL